MTSKKQYAYRWHNWTELTRFSFLTNWPMGKQGVSGVFRGHGAMPPFGPTIKIFYRRLYMKRCVFCRFPVNFRKKVGEFAASIERSKAKSVSASGGLRPPDPPTRGSASGPRWGLRPQTPVIGSRSARLPWSPFAKSYIPTARR